MAKRKKKLGDIDKILKERDEYFKETGKYLSYGQFVAMKRLEKSKKKAKK